MVVLGECGGAPLLASVVRDTVVLEMALMVVALVSRTGRTSERQAMATLYCWKVLLGCWTPPRLSTPWRS